MLSRTSLFFPLRGRSPSPALASYYNRRPSLPGAINSSLPSMHQRPFSAVASLLQDSVLLDVGVIGLIGSVFYLYRQSSRANESLQSTKLDLREEQVLNLNLKTEMEKIQTLYRQSSDDLSRTAQQLKTTSEHRESVVQEIERLKSLVELQKTSDLGQMGEATLEGLLEEAVKENLIESFDVQPTVNNLRPDAIATLKNGRTLVIDSKAGDKQMESTDEARQQYAKNLKTKMTDLHSKGYTAQVPQSYNTVWMLLPHDRDLQRAYEGNDVLSDDHRIHQHAQEKNIQLVGPESFLCSLRILQLVHLEQEKWATQDNLKDPSTLLGPILTDLVKQYRKTENKHKQLIQEHNTFVTKLVEYHKTGQEVLDSDKLNKRSIPKGLSGLESLDGLLPDLKESSVSSSSTDFCKGS